MRRIVFGLLLVFIVFSALAQTPPSPKKPAASPVSTKSAAPAPAPRASARSGPSLCITSIVGHRFEVQTIGLTIFGNALEPVDTTAWGLDDLIVRKVGAVVGSHFVVRRLVLNKSALETFEAPKKSIFEGGPLFRDSAKEFVDMLKATAVTAPKCDFYLAIFRGLSRIGDTHQYLSGIGMLNRDAGFASSQLLFVIIGASLYEGKTFELRKTERLRTGPAFDLIEHLTGPGFRGLYRQVDKSWLPNPPQAAVQNLKLRDAVWTLIEPALANTIPALLSEERVAAPAQ